MIIKRADGASSAQIVTVFVSRALVDILTLPNHFTDIALIITPPLAFGLRTARCATKCNGMEYTGAFQIREGL